MRRLRGSFRCVGLASWLTLCGLAANAVSAEPVLLRFDKGFDLQAVQSRGVKISPAGRALRLAAGRTAERPGITIAAPAGVWDLAAFEYLTFELKNVAETNVEVDGSADSPGARGAANYVADQVKVSPGEEKVLKVRLYGRMPEALGRKLFGMRGYPGGWFERRGIDVRRVTRLRVVLGPPRQEHVLQVGAVRAGGSRPVVSAADAKKLFPLIDQFGQFAHKDWPGKVKSAEDLAGRKQEEAADLAAHPGPQAWDRYGGWKTGPQLQATGRFQVQKHRGTWWLVDPEGRLFWSHGVDCVRSTTGSTPITDRRHYFAKLPEKDSPLGQFYGQSAWAPHGYYKDKKYETYNFTGANLWRKYGRPWKRQFANISHRRLRSWAMNTIANWSDPEIYLRRNTPYVVTVHGRSKPLEGSSGYWGKFPDVFDPSFAEGLKQAAVRPGHTASGDPWCLGYFVGNELSWGDELSLAIAALVSPPDQPAKRAFVDDLKHKYETIQRLNRAWGTRHASWDALLENTTPPDKKRADDDLAAFSTKTAERYFQVCREAVHEADPGGLYLGCRFAWVNDRAVRAAAKYCDVVSFNRYARSVAEFRLPTGVDKPVVIGEFHFGALDRGMFHTGLVPVASQAKRAEAYKSYVRGALEHPWIVGTHWFQYGDQATTGRRDGENYQIGLLDIGDTPYPETIQAVREVGYRMYRYRQAKAEQNE